MLVVWYDLLLYVEIFWLEYIKLSVRTINKNGAFNQQNHAILGGITAKFIGFPEIKVKLTALGNRIITICALSKHKLEYISRLKNITSIVHIKMHLGSGSDYQLHLYW